MVVCNVQSWTHVVIYINIRSVMVSEQRMFFPPKYERFVWFWLLIWHCKKRQNDWSWSGQFGLAVRQSCEQKIPTLDPPTHCLCADPGTKWCHPLMQATLLSCHWFPPTLTLKEQLNRTIISVKSNIRFQQNELTLVKYKLQKYKLLQLLQP